MKTVQLAIVGGGPAGLAAAAAAYDAGLRDILILERSGELGGILNQCIHAGFGLHTFHQELTGPEYAQRYIDAVHERGIPAWTDCMVLDITPDRVLTVTGRAVGLQQIKAQAVVLAMGCRERPRGALNIAGTRPAGIWSAGTAQRMVNMEGYLPGRQVVILGSGDIGLIMARRMTLEGAKVLACVELMPYSSGLNRNIVQCLHDFGIPLYLSHTVTDIQGKDRLERVVVSKVGADRRPISGTEMVFDCDTLLLSVGLIPENELTRRAGIEMDRRTSGPSVFENMETSLPGVFACGNVVHVHDLVDFVTAEAEKAGRSAAGYVLHGAAAEGRTFATACGACVTYTVPQHIRLSAMEDRTEVSFRVNRSFAKSRVLVTDETGAVIAKFARQHMAPGEMEHIALPRVLLEKAAGQTLTLACEEVSE